MFSISLEGISTKTRRFSCDIKAIGTKETRKYYCAFYFYEQDQLKFLVFVNLIQTRKSNLENSRHFASDP